jgi:hypothetical protein
VLKNEVEGQLLLEVVIGQSVAMLSGKNETLLP